MDAFLTLAAPAEGKHTEKMSKFLSFAIPVSSREEARQEIAKKQNEYHDARHVCWAFMVGARRDDFLSSDNGEPSGTAGKPILGQINSFGLTNVVVIVVRYFGGIKLGTPGLIAAYREAARQALSGAEIVEMHERAAVSFTFPYEAMNDVMKVAKMPISRVVSQQFDNLCSMAIECNADDLPEIVGRLSGIGGVSINE